MTYAYGMKGVPAVGGGLGGLPRRRGAQQKRPTRGALEIVITKEVFDKHWIELGGRWDVRLNGLGIDNDFKDFIQETEDNLPLDRISDVKTTPDGEYTVFCAAIAPSASQFSPSVVLRHTNLETGEDRILVDAFNSFTEQQGVTKCTVSDDGEWIGIITLSSPKVIFFKNNKDGTLTRSPSEISIGSTGRCIAFSKSAEFVYVGSNGTDVFMVIRNNGDGTFTKASVPAAPSGGNSPSEIAVTPSDEYVITTASSSPYIQVYKNNFNGTLTKLASPPVGSGKYSAGSVRISSDGETVALGPSNSPLDVDLYTLRANGTLTKLPAIKSSSKTGLYSRGVGFSNDDQFLISFSGTSSSVTFFTIYEKVEGIYTPIRELEMSGLLGIPDYNPIKRAFYVTSTSKLTLASRSVSLASKPFRAYLKD